MWKFYKIFVHLKKILEFFFSNLKSLLLGRFLRFGGLVFANIPNLRFLTNFVGAKKRVPPKMSKFFCLSLLLIHYIEFTYSWYTHLLLPSYSNLMKKWNPGAFAHPPCAYLQNECSFIAKCSVSAKWSFSAKWYFSKVLF